jgi:hypothetical protein
VTRIVLHDEAKAELRAAARWYNRELPGLGRDFREESKAAIARIVVAVMHLHREPDYWKDRV